MIGSIFILNREGNILIEKHYRGNIPRSIVDLFLKELNKAGTAEEVLPIIPTPRNYLVHNQHEDVYLLATVSKEMPPLLILEFLHRVCEIFEQYFGSVNEQSVRDNFVTVYQLLDEMLDHGIPFTTEPNALTEMIPQQNMIKKLVGGITGQSSMSTSIPDGSLSATPWRKMGVKYTTNEIYFDLIEEISTTIESNGLPVGTEVVGEISSMSKLSGMPDLTMTFNQPSILDDVSFHPCVRHKRYEQQKIVSFVPPDGQFKLMSYRVKGQLQLPIYVKPSFSLRGTNGKVSVQVGSKVQGKTVEDVVITIPFPKSVISTSLTANHGKVEYNQIDKVCLWRIGKIPVTKVPLLEGSVSLDGSKQVEANPVVRAAFKVSMYAVSGLKVDSLNITGEGYKPYKGVRSVTKSGKVDFRSQLSESKNNALQKFSNNEIEYSLFTLAFEKAWLFSLGA